MYLVPVPSCFKLAVFLASTTRMCELTAPPSVAAKDGDDGSMANSALPIITAAVAADTGGASKF